MSPAASPTTLVWYRQDLRLHDHAPLAAAAADGGAIVPVYVLDESGWGFGGASRWWLHHSLHALAQDLEKRGLRLILRRGEAAVIIPGLAAELGATTVHAGIAHEPAWRAIDTEVAAALQNQGARLHLHRVATLADPEKIRTRTGSIYGVYSPFARAVEEAGDPPDPVPMPRKKLHAPARQPASDRLEDWSLLPNAPDWAGGLRATWQPGEAAALRRLSKFLDTGIASYGTTRNLPGEDGTSMLSPHLHFGEISPNTIWHACRQRGGGPDREKFLRELLWREFSAYLLWYHPSLPDQPLRPAFANLPWRTDTASLRAWQKGLTGIPIVDAGMRQLWQTGWMHNRVRMIVASFLVKHLLISWQQGEAWFWDTLVDADLASNAASWQWVTGSGIDSQPYFRVFNPVTQGEKFDPAGAYVRRFVPEIASLPDRHLHTPWLTPPLILAETGIRLGRTYPAPIVDLAEGRQRALEVFTRTVRQGAA
jgi:deoxyribodipyrimidine photo-lyase